MDSDIISALRRIAAEVRQDVVRMHRLGTNVASAMSAVDLLVTLYFNVLHIPRADDPARDRFILSKGHGASALYSTLARRGFFDLALLATYLHDQSPLAGHPSIQSLPGVEVSSGSLGHGLAIGTGMAMAAQQEAQTYRVIVMMGDGELQEGSVWEAANLASRLKLDNLTGIVDVNNLQGYDRVDKLMPLASLADKWRAFGWQVIEIDGHDYRAIQKALNNCSTQPGKPTVILARTVKGKGVKEMEDQLGWHYYSVPPEKIEPFVQELEALK